jgi:hypothetical protein
VASFLGNVAGALTPQNDYSVDTSGFINALNQAQQNSQANIGNQNALAQALLAQSNGSGPNPVQSQLMQNANSLSQQQAGAIAGQKGINPALAARQIGMQGAQAQQTAAGQAATLGAQQQIAAQGQLANVYGTIGNEAQGANQTATSALTAGNNTNAAAAAQNATANQGTVSGLFGGAASALQSIHFSRGGMVPVQRLAYGGPPLGAYDLQGSSAYMPLDPANNPFAAGAQAPQLGSSAVGMQPLVADNALGGTDASNAIGQQSQDFQAALNPKPQAQVPVNFGNGGASQSIANQIAAMANMPVWAAGNTGNNSGLHSAGSLAGTSALGGGGGAAALAAFQGAHVPGRPEVAGDSLKNDKVPAMLSPGEIVLPRSVAQDADAPDLAKEFVEHLERRGKPEGFGKVLEARRKAGKA